MVIPSGVYSELVYVNALVEMGWLNPYCEYMIINYVNKIKKTASICNYLGLFHSLEILQGLQSPDHL